MSWRIGSCLPASTAIIMPTPNKLDTTLWLVDGLARPEENGGTSSHAQPAAGRGGGTVQHAGNRRTHAFKDAHKAAIGNHHRKDRALRKMGGPAG